MSNIKQGSAPTEADILNAGAPVAPQVIQNGVQSKPLSELIPASSHGKSRDEIESELSLIKLEKEKLSLEKEKLDLEKLTNDIQGIRRQQEAQRIARENVQESLDYERNTRIFNETNCTHMKGGGSETMMHGGPAQGNDASNFAMIQHTLTTGVTFRMCQRCGKTWFPKDPDYRWAMTRPTRNSPSTGSPSPGLVRNGNRVRLVSEVPHMKPAETDYNIPEYRYPNQDKKD